MKIRTEINGIDWGVDFTTNLTEVLFGRNGLCSYEENCIYILGNMSPQKTKLTLIHELTHAYDFQYGLRNRKSDSEPEDLAQFVSLYGEQIIKKANELLSEITK